MEFLDLPVLCTSVDALVHGLPQEMQAIHAAIPTFTGGGGPILSLTGKRRTSTTELHQQHDEQPLQTHPSRHQALIIKGVPLSPISVSVDERRVMRTTSSDRKTHPSSSAAHAVRIVTWRRAPEMQATAMGLLRFRGNARLM